MKRVILVASALLLAGLAFNTAAGAQSVRPRAVHNSTCTAKGTISYMFWGDKGEEIEQDAAIKQVEHICPKLKVKALYTPNNYDTDLATEIGTGNAPDVFQLDADKRIPEFVATDHALTDLSPYIKAAHFNPAATYWAACIKQSEYKGQIYGLMRDCGNQNMFLYNKDMFAARHVPLPTNSWTLSTFAKDAKKLTGIYAVPGQPKAAHFGIGVQNNDFQLNSEMFAFGGNWLTPSGKCNLTAPGSVAGMQWWHDLMYKVHGAPTWAQAQVSGWDPYDAFKNEKEAMYQAGPWALDYLVKPSAYTGQKPVSFKWGVVLPPAGPHGRNGVVDAAVEGVYSKSHNKQAAFDFVRYLTTTGPAALEAKYGIGLPGDVKLSESSDAKSEYAPYLKTWLLGTRYSQPERSNPHYDKLIADVLGNSTSPIQQFWGNAGEKASTAAKAACTAAGKDGDFS
jgi:ABC-type glycerol-3-phosphate transport system substrate-binding protein